MSNFEFTPTDTGGQVALLQTRMFSKRPVPTDAWHSQAGPELIAAVRYLKRLVDSGDASSTGNVILLTTQALLEMPGTILAQIGVPSVAPLSLKLSLHGRIESPEGEIDLSWTDSSYRSLVPTRQGLIVRWAGKIGRLTAPIYSLVDAIDQYNATKGQPSENRIAVWARVQQRLQSLTGTEVEADRILRSFRIFQAGAFSLDVRQTVDGPQFNPVLMSAALRATLADEADAPEDGVDPSDALRDETEHALLSPELQKQFLRAFNQDSLATRPSYVLAPNTYLVVEPELQKALDVVKRAQRASAGERRRFVQNPRAALVQAMPDADETTGTIFIETRQYSERVTELGIWEKPKLDWIRRKGTGWLPEAFELQVGSRSIRMDEDGLKALALALEESSARGDEWVQYNGMVLATEDVSAAFERLERGNIAGVSPEMGTSSEAEEKPQPDRAVLKKKENLEEVEFTIDLRPRPLFAQKLFPSDLVVTTPKPHQTDGFGWLVDAWTSGLPGVLLADDMGLGKTMQALAFLAWFRENRRVGGIRAKQYAGPILVVAPTALLRNWAKEADIHLAEPGLGDCLAAFGTGLARIRRRDAAPEDALDVDAIRRAEWVLTTYETLANYHRAFARVAYPIIVFDEMQKIKAPDTINTHAAKVMNADFVLGMTGTPIENRIEDLWCLMDRVAPGYLGALRPFSQTYGGEDEASLRMLKSKIDQPQPGHPPLLLRRMKGDHLRGLPPREVKKYWDPVMPAPQSEAYAEVVRAAKAGARSKGDMLRALHSLRGISLHPNGADGIDPYDARSRTAWIESSARVQQTLSILDKIRRQGEKALVFIEDRAVQSVFAAVVAAHFELPAEPDIINGETPGDRRQQIVDRFQSLPPGFAVLVLSPKAAGVGLTITAANHVIHLSRWWNPAVEDQCNDRVYRIGQEKPVYIHVPLATHPAYGEASFDLKLDDLLERKRTLGRDMLMPPVSDRDATSLYAEAVASVGA